MLSAIKLYFAQMSTWLILLKYLGLCLAAGSSIWGTVNELTVKTKSGKTRLTTAGIVAVSFTVLGLVISLVSEDLQRRDAEATRDAQMLAEAKRTKEIIVSGQQLTSLSLHWQLSSTNATLWEVMTKGQSSIKENAESSQGGVPIIPFEVEEYRSALLPLMLYVAGVGDKGESGETAEADQREQAGEGDETSKVERDLRDGNFVVLIALDPSPNSVLSFGSIGSGTTWVGGVTQGKLLSAGFVESDEGARVGNSTPRVSVDLAANSGGGESKYAIDWDLDPGTLASVVDRRNETVSPTANLPSQLQVAIFYDFIELPFQQNDFGAPDADVWGRKEWARRPINFDRTAFAEMNMLLEVNGIVDLPHKYILKGMYISDLHNDWERDFDARCTILEFEAI